MCFLPHAAFSQQTAVYAEPDATYRSAKELFDKEKYGAARQLFLQVIEQADDQRGEISANAQLYAAISAYELFNPDAGEQLMAFVDNHPTHAGRDLAWFHLGNLHYRDRNYGEAISWYTKLYGTRMDRKKLDEFYFKLGYSHFMLENLSEAAPLFRQIQDPESIYYAPASYYYGHIAYLNGNYASAITHFERIMDDRNFGQLIPYYIIHIYYLQGEYDELLVNAPMLYEEAIPRRTPEIARLIGEAHVERAQYAEAIPYLEEYISHAGRSASRGDHYQLGYVLYSLGRYEEAIPHLERTTAEEDSLAQNAYFHLASAYIETNQKRYARNAFSQAHQMDFHEDIQRESLFNYALLSLELSMDPHNEAILSFRQYIEKYPDSPRINEAYEYLIDLYLTTSNYRDALASLELIDHETRRLREAYQRVSFLRGVELFNNRDFAGAVSHFEKTRRYQENSRFVASSLYWEGEAHYRKGDYARALSRHQDFLVSPGAFSLDFYDKANYSIGYAHFKKESWAEAITAFRKFISAGDQDPNLLNDAVLRTADSYFVSKQYQPAMNFYNRAIQLDVIDTDYAVYQKGLVYGIMGEIEEKITTMEDLLANYPGSAFLDDGRYEIANSWLLLNDNPKAREYFYEILEHHPGSSHAQSARLKIGLVYYNENDDERALETFKKVVEDYPGTSQAQEALSAMRSIYVDLDRVADFVRFTEDIGIADITEAEEDSLVYQAAENRYMQGDCSGAVQSFNNYLDQFPGGIFAANAQYYRSECLYRANETNEALGGYEYIIDGAHRMFLEVSLLRAAAIRFSRGDYEMARTHYAGLEEVTEDRNNTITARKGQMRCLFHLGNSSEAISKARQVLEHDRLSQDDRQEAWYIKAISAKDLHDTDKAREAFEKVASITENRRAAEARYNLARITFEKGHYEEAEEEIFSYTGKLSAYDFWLARTLLLLADLYIETDNAFQAKHTLNSIIENYDGEDLQQEAKQKLAFIEEHLEAPEEEEEEDVIEIDLD